MKKTEDPRPNVKGAERLTRLVRPIKKKFPLQNSTFSLPLQLYTDMLHAIGQTNISRSIIGLLHIISAQLFRYPGCEDDFVRRKLKILHEWAFPRVFEDGPAFTLLCHLHALGSKTPYDKKQIEDDITEWVKGERTFSDPAWVKAKLESLFTRWGNTKCATFLTFRDYCNDPIRWGTSGGAPKSVLFGETYRTKWGWAFSRVLDERGRPKKCDLYADALLASPVAKVALKEEPTKTRPIITTPIASYLRQAYLVYRWGKPKHINSPISSNAWLPNFMATNYAWYGCIDGKRFDHCIPKWFVTYFVSRLGALDAECRAVADDEVADLESLTIAWNDRTWDWKGGVLSGWRFTSLLGTVASWLAAEWIMERTPLGSGAMYGALGDDLILASNTTSIDKKTLCDSYIAFGLDANMSKTTAGPVGEFLRKTYSPRGIESYPALAVRSLCYANPWLESYSYESALDASTSWLTLYSRLLPHRLNDDWHNDFFNQVCSVISTVHPELPRSGIRDWLHTPISAGGGGPDEWSIPARWMRIVNLSEVGTNRDSFLQVLGVLKTSKAVRKIPLLRPICIRAVEKELIALKSVEAHNNSASFPDDLNITLTLVRWYIERSMTSLEFFTALKCNPPRGIRNASLSTQLAWVMGLNSSSSGLSTVQFTKETCASYVQQTKTLTATYTSTKRGASIRLLGPAATMYAHQLLHGVVAPAGTW